MKRDLRDRRDQAGRRHDAALERYPTREGRAFQSELQALIDELSAIAALADRPASDPVEVAKTYRWLGDACFDLANGKAPEILERGVHAYERSELLLRDADAPAEKAKLNFNYGNTLRGLSGGSDVGLLEAAQTRYEEARAAFRRLKLPDLVDTVEQQLLALEPQLRLARRLSAMKEGKAVLQDCATRAAAAGVVERDEIARKLAELRKVPRRSDLAGDLDEAMTAIRQQAEKNPERFAGKEDALASLKAQMEGLADMMAASSPAAPAGESGDWEGGVMRLLLERLRTEESSGRVTPDRAARLQELMQRLGAAMSSGGDDLKSHAEKAERLRDLTQQMADMAMSPSWGATPPPVGSRADKLLSVVDSLKRFLVAEKGRAMLPSEEAGAGTDLMVRLLTTEADVRSPQGASPDAEAQVWRLALAVQAHARRHHLLLAQPDFPTAGAHAGPKSLFLSGGEHLLTVAKTLAAREGYELLHSARRSDLARERWNQLWSASMAVFDVGVPEGAERAQVCYELGLALALGKPIVVTHDSGKAVPFDVDLQTLPWSLNLHSDADLLEDTLLSALGSITWGGTQSEPVDGAAAALAWLCRRYRDRLADGPAHIAFDLARGAQGDACAFSRAVVQLLGFLGADAPKALLPAWPPAYPDPSKKPRLFHVMPFRPTWSNPVRDATAKVCRKQGWEYTRGDEAEAQRIIPGIWQEIVTASAVLVDVTGHNPNVALELGLVHAIGRRYRLVAQDNPSKHLFPSIEKVQVHSYGVGPPLGALEDHVRGLLAGREG